MKVAIIPVDTLIYQKLKEDVGSPVVKRMMGQVSFRTELIQPVPNDKEVIRKILARVADAGIADLVLTIGGIGCRENDWVPEATKAIIEKEIPGMAEAMRLYMVRTRKRAMLTRGVAGIRRNTLIVNLPGSPKVIKECLEYILPEIVYTVEVLLGEHDDINE
ncbi:MogA/MoaB family molybdenum cofactor biosynthesis protein [Bariatricus massiliensis]|uniref:MogA/MoaB family molybdenum cofactor biosynthesis protein n=1 Tax=Bariatricus massiliensis TaxID=1745713 RepID=A0ABS8DBS9_9FIRM|nr:MogA/MoaB family molybdenum cofactor biosynthesis protein [Bariatricus massiliensis]MCB7303732.1 MogA/MoaB family molybdenum cofactor biosynthesis protein [Bariatricus massiliensis]MCB7373148.1 MogA/MoaB family molybdenum cofactor biosynthesis protein [Bariatricus massiliensis]MCB7385818.1 MogA/MoaB family molybdenum cofactor biosynthesis protein [Bariatricus massiliensis]MCB7409980.1 MogA/MoaB family molybdenum cofactor biosynthesis protein [Bariatricus massiliensis]MCQ5253052.1 MogA/MoaB 